ncbi:hypothetical protein VCSRO55_2823 [Vibrio cholerae]|uniref:RbmA family biofilm matrix protein n=1 Tax=Vibrio cholerae TaxID=666 RepID=UPI001651EBC6|nr:hypothetical protein [Vibrio cholerae]EJL6653316.1 hypothetical protein [Vibrio cholerae]GHW28079.1 hypothetical protein VCSRO55_2823 [Vibrio cholerae]GHX02461.1 hypothetical protein VCSRO60_0461 [Vibrio cholerae]HAS3585096.1 hypothetical protein [Vibrio cholerae]
MNKRHYYLASCLALLFSTASYAEVDCELQPVIEANLSLNQNQLASNGGYISSQLGIRNESCETVKFKYWLSIKGPEGIYFPAKAVVGVDTAQQESDALTDSRMLNVTRGIFIPDYLADGVYTVSLQIVTEDGDIFKASQYFAKGVTAVDETPNLDGLQVDVQNQFLMSELGSNGGHVPFAITLNNTRETPAKVEFWMSAVGPNGLIIPVHAREKWTVAPSGTFYKVRGFTFDKSYPEGEYTINAQVVDIVSGERVEQLMTVVKK